MTSSSTSSRLVSLKISCARAVVGVLLEVGAADVVDRRAGELEGDDRVVGSRGSRGSGRRRTCGPRRRGRWLRRAVRASFAGTGRGRRARRRRRPRRRRDRATGRPGRSGSPGVGSICEQLLEGGVAADRGRGQHERAQLVAEALRVAGGDQAAHRMPDQHHGQPGCSARAASATSCRSAVIASPSSTSAGRAVGTAVTAMVGRVHRCAEVVDEPLRDMLVAAGVLAVAVRDEDDAPRLGRGPAVDIRGQVRSFGSWAGTPRRRRAPRRNPRRGCG